jgi:hypothetical protein
MLVWQGMLVARYVEPGKPCHQTEFPPTARGCGTNCQSFRTAQGVGRTVPICANLSASPTASW